MKKSFVNYAVGIAICLTMALAPIILYGTVKAGIDEFDGKVLTAETPSQYAEEFSGGKSEPETTTDVIFIPDTQLEVFKQKGLNELSRLGLELPDSFEFLSYFNDPAFLPDDAEAGLFLGLLWCNKDAPREYISIGFIGVDIDEGTGSMYFIQAQKCYDMSLLSGFADTGKSKFLEILNPIPENYETSAFIVWQYPIGNTHPETRVQIMWSDPMENQIMTNLSLTDPFPDLLNYSVTFDKANIEKQKGKVISMFRFGVYLSQHSMFRPLEDFTDAEMELMEEAARSFAEDMSIYVGEVLSVIGQNFGADASGARFEFDSKGRNGYEQNVIITVTNTGMVVGYAISL